MNLLDIVLAVILALSILSGAMKGFTRLAIGLVATVLGFVLAAGLYETAGSWALPYTSSRGIAHFLGFLVIFFGTVLLGGLVGRLAANVFRWVGLSWLDRLLGGALGAVRGAIICIVLLLVIGSFLPGDPPRSVVESRIAHQLMGATDLASSLTPDDMKQQFRQTYEKVKLAWLDPLQQRLEQRAQ